MNDSKNNSNIIIDNGTGYCKVGLSDSEPDSYSSPYIFPNYILKPKFKKFFGYNIKDFYIGSFIENLNETKKKIYNLVCYPNEYGMITNWEDIENIWEYIFKDKLNVESNEHNVMITEPLMNPKINREKIAQIMFEKFDVPGLFIANQCALSLFYFGKTVGYVIDSGESITQFAPVFDGYVLTHSARKINLGGKNINDYLMNILSENSNFDFKNNQNIVNDIKEKFCYVPLNYYEKEKNDENYELPDGTKILLKEEYFKAPEFLFSPEKNKKIFSITQDGIHKICHYSIMSTESEIRKDLYENIFLSGGNTSFLYFRLRLEDEIKYLLYHNYHININNDVKNYYPYENVWKGGKILSSLSTFNSMWITKEEFKEYGNWIVHKKCF